MRMPFLYIVIISLFVISACKRVTLSLDKVPKNTPKGAQIFVTGSFNNWNPGDSKYLMAYDDVAKQYYVDLPLGFGNVYYKFTRGDWTTVETDPCGGESTNRKIKYSDGEFHIDSIVGWKDLEPENCERVTLIIDRLPANTPMYAKIYLGGNINGWQCNNQRFLFKEIEKGVLGLTVPRNSDKLVFKVTRGSWASAELDENGSEQLQREIAFGQSDTVYLQIGSWADMPMEKVHTKTIVIGSMPKEKKGKQDLYIACNLNNWNPLDVKYKFSTTLSGKYYFKVSYSGNEPFVYKITKGGWDKVETDRKFNDIGDRALPLNGNDTVWVNIQAWADDNPSLKSIKNTERIVNENARVFTSPINPSTIAKLIEQPAQTTAFVEYDKRKKVFIIIDNLPNFGKNNTIYLTGDFNGWNDKDENYQFRNLPNGKKYFLLRLDDNEQHEFKITRGSWDKEEANYSLERLSNRVIKYGAENDTIHVSIERWFDETAQQKIVMLLNATPENTPPNESIYLTGDFNDWAAREEQYKFKRLVDGRYVLTITDFSKRYNLYKITRGSWETEATTKSGRIPDNQLFKPNATDTIKVRIERWKDL